MIEFEKRVLPTLTQTSTANANALTGWTGEMAALEKLHRDAPGRRWARADVAKVMCVFVCLCVCVRACACMRA